MISRKFYILLFAILCESNGSSIRQAIFQLVKGYYGDSSVVIEVFYNSEKVKILDETLKLLSAGTNLKLTPINTNEIDLDKLTYKNCIDNKNDFCYQTSENDAIFFFDTLENYLKLKTKFIYRRHSAFQSEFFNHLVYAEDANKQNLQSILEQETYESFLLEENGQLSLHAMTMFTEVQCGVVQLIEINQFSSLEQKWENEKFFRPRIKNFHGCELWIFISNLLGEISLPFARTTKIDDATEITEGAFLDMVETLSRHLNFTFTTADRNIEDALDTNPDLIFEPKILRRASKSLSSLSSDPVCTASDVFVVPPGELFTPWEKLLMPFDRPTWKWLGIVFAVAFLVILFIKVTNSTSMYEFVIGLNVSTPSLNVIAIFMGIGQIFVPRRNVARFMFISFILFSLVMRTAYQGKYFEFLTSAMRKKPVESVEELAEKNFTLVVVLHNNVDFDMIER